MPITGKPRITVAACNRAGCRVTEIAGRNRSQHARVNRTRLLTEVGDRLSHRNLPGGSCIGVLRKEGIQCKETTTSIPDAIVVPCTNQEYFLRFSQFRVRETLWVRAGCHYAGCIFVDSLRQPAITPHSPSAGVLSLVGVGADVAVSLPRGPTWGVV